MGGASLEMDISIVTLQTDVSHIVMKGNTTAMVGELNITSQDVLKWSGGIADTMNDSQLYNPEEIDILNYLRGSSSFPSSVNITLSLLFGLGSVANIILAIYIAKSKKYQIPIFTLFASLAVCDILTCVWALIMGRLVFPVLVPRHRFGASLVCHISISSASLAYKSSLLHLMFLSGMRFYQLTNPLAAQVRITVTRIVMACLGMWLIGACFSVPFAVIYKPYTVLFNGKSVSICHFHADRALREIIYIFQLVVPTLTIAIFHVLKQWKLSRNPTLSKQEVQSKSRSTNSRAVTMLIAIFILSILPRFLHTIYHSILGFPNQEFHMRLFTYSRYISYLNSVANPFIYLFCSRDVRQDMYRVLFQR